ncbi:BBA14 family lipoprotein [Borreliella lusitaniae]|uniref:BBA14 family lipoprotein n=1 Tax=Borreliella lusitaniae TaxID=100177 RepID=UPI00292DCA0E|nr:BBA14 family lipoprotein [Borreliella lusitaniae]WNY67286.1 BBA14 family lipoprotein [Borreliella lusitaniae]
MKIKNLPLLFLLNMITLFSCSTIASLPKEPTYPKEPTLKALSLYEAHLSSYIMYLQTFLVKTKQKVNNKNYPEFQLFDTSKLEKDQTVKSIKTNIAHLKNYIDKIKPIAIQIYKKYSKNID